ncbi:putative membrane protein [Paraburkholderia xenovorans LB400]|uniref:Transmembrane protein n=1 Tax=Paraburkholderia xenovorans (strain LB400) TaxID=266265 RepID=Q13HS1_PARXL|nr:hypothetical protein [Paraburkholderia xenovorans]ABE36368.1 hypothetical protein Bxe_C0464 [Paraburkholderia xenovorans LB400]AIP34627.1 putative membrane protein [Paraburkholderia xenovorans LB400]
MGVLKLALIIAVVVGVAKGIQLFNRHCRRRFGHSFFTTRGFWLAAIAINLLWWGFYFWGTAFVHHTTTSDGIILMVLGIVAIAWLLYENIRETDIVHGIGGSTLQLVLFLPLALYSFPLLIMGMVFVLVASYKAGPALFIER